MTRINPANDEKREPEMPNVLITRTEAQRDAILADSKEARREALRRSASGLIELMADWNFRPVDNEEQEAMIALLRGKHFGEPVANVTPIMLHKVTYNDTLETATVAQPWSMALVENLATGRQAILLGYLDDVTPVLVPRTNERGLTVLNPLVNGPEMMVKRKMGRVVYNYEWTVLAVRPVTEEDSADEGLFSLASIIGEAFAELLVSPIEEEVETPAVTGGIDFSKVSF